MKSPRDIVCGFAMMYPMMHLVSVTRVCVRAFTRFLLRILLQTIHRRA